MVKPLKLGHLVLRVRDIDRCARFYTDVLGLHVTSRIGDRMVFMTADEEASHELALMAISPDSPGPEPERVGLYHFAWQMESLEGLQRLYREMKEKDVKIGGIGDHGISLGVYFFDPEGNEIEVFYELPRDQWPEGETFQGSGFPGSLEEVTAS